MLKHGQANHLLRTRAIFLFLLPCFFVLHGFILNYGSVPVKDAIVLTLMYMGAACIIAVMGWLFYHDPLKASLLAFIIMTYHFFFGDIQSMLKDRFPQSAFLHYRVIVPVSIVFFVLIVIWLRKRSKPLVGIVFYLNTLLLLLLAIDAGRLAAKVASPEKNSAFQPGMEGLTICDTCRKSDIFLIVPDEYSGNTALKNVFHYDNTAFENALRLRGFHISEKSSSNYNLTPFSMASMLNMDYINIKGGAQNYETVSYSYNLIKNSRIVQYLIANNYQFYNCSVFNFPSQPANEYGAFLPYGTKLITEKTFISRLVNDFRSDILAGKYGLTSLRKNLAYKYLHFNDAILELTKKNAKERIEAPKFVYTHLMLPHTPYYFDSKGNLLSLETIIKGDKANPANYVEYLQYGNTKILGLVDYILTNSPTPPVIILLSDHGYRNFEVKADRKYDFMNLNAIYFPDKDYSLFNDSITNVNQFRMFFNTRFGQHLPLLKDSMINVFD